MLKNAKIFLATFSMSIIFSGVYFSGIYAIKSAALHYSNSDITISMSEDGNPVSVYTETGMKDLASTSARLTPAP